MKHAIIFHGTGGSPNVVWIPWLKDRLTQRDYTVETPHYPQLNVEPIATFLPKVLTQHHFTADTVLIGHSGGAALLLSLLQHLNLTIQQAILVAGYSTPPNTAPEPVLQTSYDWPTIRARARDFCFINSTDDPYGCNDTQGRTLLDHLGGTLILRQDGHFGSELQDYPQFPLLERLIP